MMKKMYLCILIFLCVNAMNAQENNCLDYKSDNTCLRYTAFAYQDVVNGNHSKAINESRKIANLIAETELAKMVNSVVTRVTESMTMDDGEFLTKYIDTTLISSYKILKDIRTVCQSKTKLIDNSYVTYVTKEISIDAIGEMLNIDNDNDRQKFKKLLSE